MDGERPRRLPPEGEAYGHTARVRLLLSSGATSVGAADTDGDTPLHVAAMNGLHRCRGGAGGGGRIGQLGVAELAERP